MFKQVKMSKEEKKAFDEGCERLKATFDEHMFKACYMSETELNLRMFMLNIFTLLLLPLKITINNELRLLEYFVYCKGDDDDDVIYMEYLKQCRRAKRLMKKHYLLAWTPGWFWFLQYNVYCKLRHIETDEDKLKMINEIFSKYE